MKKSRFMLSVISVFAAVFAFAANAFAASPCIGPYYEPEIPKELMK